MDSQTERQFYLDNFSKENLGEFYYLVGHFITGYRSVNEWRSELLPYLMSLSKGDGKINDWNSFDWKGEVCFRNEYILILDESIHKNGRKFPGLFDSYGNQILNDEYQWLLDTEFIISNYSEFVKIGLPEFIEFCLSWIKLLEKA